MSKYILLLLLLLLLLIIIIINTPLTNGRLSQEYSRRLRMILKSELNTRNKTTATGALAVPILRHSFGIINWRT